MSSRRISGGETGAAAGACWPWSSLRHMRWYFPSSAMQAVHLSVLTIRLGLCNAGTLHNLDCCCSWHADKGVRQLLKPCAAILRWFIIVHVSSGVQLPYCRSGVCEERPAPAACPSRLPSTPLQMATCQMCCPLATAFCPPKPPMPAPPSARPWRG